MSEPIIKTFKQAEEIAGTLGRPSKMPGYAYGLPVANCIIGAKLAKVTGSVCSKCYAAKGHYGFKSTVEAQKRRLASLKHPQWVDAMVWMIDKRGHPHFRWHDSGDIQGLWHLDLLVEVARRLPHINFWLPTREKKMIHDWMVKNGRFPKNLVVRVSSTMIDGPAPIGFPNTSTVVTDKKKATCPAYNQGGVCGDCRACWNPRVKNVSYPKH